MCASLMDQRSELGGAVPFKETDDRKRGGVAHISDDAPAQQKQRERVEPELRKRSANVDVFCAGENGDVMLDAFDDVLEAPRRRLGRDLPEWQITLRLSGRDSSSDVRETAR